jgi:hypothetical protein
MGQDYTSQVITSPAEMRAARALEIGEKTYTKIRDWAPPAVDRVTDLEFCLQTARALLRAYVDKAPCSSTVL